MSSQKKTVVITGGTKGIGLDITRSFHSSGYKVFVGARSHPSISELPPDIEFLSTDVCIEDDVEALIRKAFDTTARIDVLINNAGFSAWRPLELISDDFLTQIMKTNLFSAFWACKHAVPFMRSGSSIINVSSIAGKRGSANNSAYVASKFAMNGFTQSLCKELGPKGIRVNSVCPVLVSTPGLLTALSDKHSPSFGLDPSVFISEFAQANSALKRLPTGGEVSATCVFLASELASAITGQNINIDCGVFPQ